MKQYWESQKSQPKCQLTVVKPWVATDRLQEDILKRRKYPAVGVHWKNASCRLLQNCRQLQATSLLEEKSRSAFVPWYSEERGITKAAGWSDRTGRWILQQCWHGVNSGKIHFRRAENVVNKQVQTVWTEKMSDFRHVQQKQRFLFSEAYSYFFLLLKAFYNSLRHSIF